MGRQSGESIHKKSPSALAWQIALSGVMLFCVARGVAYCPTQAGNNCPCKVSTFYASEIRKAIRNEAETSRLAGDP